MSEDHVAPEIPSGDRETAPQSPFDSSAVVTGVIVLVVGLALTFGLAYGLA